MLSGWSALSGRCGQVCQFLAANSNQAMHTRDIARHLGLPTSGHPLSSLTAQLCYWARNGRLTRTAPNTYEITLSEALTPPTGP